MKTKRFLMQVLVSILVASLFGNVVFATGNGQSRHWLWHYNANGVLAGGFPKCMPDPAIDAHVAQHSDGEYDTVGEECGEEPTETIEPTATETIEPTTTPDFDFDWDVKINCIQPFIRVHNLSDVTVKVNGEIWANTYLVAKVPSQYEDVPPDWWGGPEGDMPANFVGTLTGWVTVSYGGSIVAQKNISQEMNCAPTTTPVTPTVTEITPTVTLVTPTVTEVTPTVTPVTPTPTTTVVIPTPTSTSKPQITPQVPAPTGAADQDISWFWVIVVGLLSFWGSGKVFKMAKIA